MLAGPTVEFGAHFVWPRTQISGAATRDGADGRLIVDLTYRVLADATYGPFVAIVWNQTAPYAA